MFLITKKFVLKNQFLIKIGPSTYDELGTLPSPRTISEYTYDKLTVLLDNYYQKQNEIVEQGSK